MATVQLAEFKNSSNIKSAELMDDGCCVVRFSNGQSYAYANFTPEMFADWLTAKSPGGWFHSHVRSKPDQHPVVAAGDQRPNPLDEIPARRPTSDDQTQALRAQLDQAELRIASMHKALSEANNRIGKLELDLAEARRARPAPAVIERGAADALPPKKSRDFRPWRRK